MIARLPRSEKERVLVLMPTGKDGRLVQSILQSAGILAQPCRNMEELCREMASGAGALLLTEETLDPASTSHLIEALSKQPAWSALPVLLVGMKETRLMKPQSEAMRLHSIAKTVMIDRPIHVRAFVTLTQEELRSRQRQYQLEELMESLEESHRQVKQLNEELEHRVGKRTSELQTMVGELQSFAYTVSHDLRAPLRALSNLSQILLEDYSGKILDPTAQDYLERIADGARRMDFLINDLLSYSRLAYADLKLQRIEPRTILTDVLGMLREDIKDKKANIRVLEPLEPMLGDPLLLSQALTNLVSNALKFVPPSVVPEINIRTEPGEGGVRLWVEDNGVGIPAAFQDRLFRVFERLRQDYPGTGIGLAIVRKAVERMGGKVGVFSEEGKGSRFWIELPKG